MKAPIATEDQGAYRRLLQRATEQSGPLDEPCWIAGHFLNNGGYAQIWVGTRLDYAHRVSYRVNTGPISTGQTVDHLCRVRACFNPAHLEAVTQKENTARGESPGAVGVRTNLCKRGHSLDDAYIQKGSGRKCRTCDTLRQRGAL